MKLGKDIPFKRKDLEKLQNLSYSEGRKIVDNMPTSMLSKLFCAVCDRNQIKDLFNEYWSYYSDPTEAQKLGDPKKIKRKYEKKLKAMIKNLRKARRIYEIPRHIREHKF